VTKCYNENKAEKAFHFSLREAPMDRAIRFLPCSGFRNILQALEAIRRVRDQYPRVLYCILQQQKACYPSLDYTLPKEDALAIREKYPDSLYNSTSDHLDLETAPAEDILNPTFDAFIGD
jgi:hypothetical protein